MISRGAQTGVEQMMNEINETNKQFNKICASWNNKDGIQKQSNKNFPKNNIIKWKTKK